jgi:hypothetical protein
MEHVGMSHRPGGEPGRVGGGYVGLYMSPPAWGWTGTEKRHSYKVHHVPTDVGDEPIITAIF